MNLPLEVRCQSGVAVRNEATPSIAARVLARIVVGQRLPGEELVVRRLTADGRIAKFLVAGIVRVAIELDLCSFIFEFASQRLLVRLGLFQEAVWESYLATDLYSNQGGKTEGGKTERIEFPTHSFTLDRFCNLSAGCVCSNRSLCMLRSLHTQLQNLSSIQDCVENSILSVFPPS